MECGGGGENKIKKVISTKCILFTIIFNNICITTKLYNKFMYNHIHFIFKKTHSSLCTTFYNFI